MPEPPHGYICAVCKHANKFTGFVFAHWRDVLKTNCEGCGAPHTVVTGHAKFDARAAKKAKKEKNE